MYSLAVPEYLKSLNTGMLVIWNVWWPMIPFLIFFSGRLWCTVCPFSATANLLNKLFPYRIISNRLLLDHRFIIGLLSFMVILSLDNIFSIAANQYYTFLFFSVLYLLVIVLAFVFDHKTYCNIICPFNLFSHLYQHLSLVKIGRNTTSCNGCKRQGWIPVKTINLRQGDEDGLEKFRENNGESQGEVIGEVIQASQSDTADWRNTVECLKKCPTNATRLLLKSPFNGDFHRWVPSTIEALAPTVIISMFAVSVFSKSNYAINIFLMLQDIYPITIGIFFFLAILVFLFTTLLLNGLTWLIAEKFFKIDRTIIVKAFYCFIPLLLLFHFSIALKDVRGIVSLQHAYSFFSVIDPYIPKKNIMQIVSYVLSVIGILISVIVLFRFSLQSMVSKSKAVSMFLLFLFSTIGANSLLTITTNKYLQYFG